MKILDLPKHLRPREKLIDKGVENLKDAELLAILFRTGREGINVVELAKQIIAKVPMKKLLQLTYPQLIEIKGIDAGKACTLLAAFELTKRALQVHDARLPLIETVQDAIDHVHEIRDYKKEHFIVLYLNVRNQLIAKETISIGTLNASIVHPREVFEPALRYCAAQLILIHNHPSGDPTPSEADEVITKRIRQAGEMMAIEVVDHLIVTKDDVYSFREHKQW